MWGMHDGGWAWWVVMTVSMVVVWGVVIYGVVRLTRRETSPLFQAPPEPPLSVLERRLAASEISVDEFERVRAALDDERRHAAQA
jgi:putative membrane protein